MNHLRFQLACCVLAITVTACAVGPDHATPETPAPEDWTTWRSSDDSLRSAIPAGESLPHEWWRAFNDPVLDELQKRAVESSPDLVTAALHFAQARVQLTGAS